MNCTKLKVLVCDDSMFSRKIIKDIMNDLSVPFILEAKDGQEAVDVFKKENPDIVFMDITMPVKTGIDALCEIKQINPNARVIVVSSSVTQNHAKQIIDNGAYCMIQKPFQKEEIKKILDKIEDGE